MYADVHHVVQIGEFSSIEEYLQSLVFLNGMK